MDENSGSGGKTASIILVVVFVLAGLVAAWYWFMYKPEQEAKEKARLEQIAKERARKKRLQEQAAKKKSDYEQLIATGNGEFEQENWEAAQSAYLEASALFPKQQYPKDQLALVNQKLEEQSTQPEAGTVEVVSAATGRYYVVVSSSIDGDLAMDYANKMAAEGNSVNLIEPYGGQRFFRVSLSNYGSLDEANSASSSFSTTDGSEIWVLKY